MKSTFTFLLASLLVVLMNSALLFADTTSTRIVVPGVIHTQMTIPGPCMLNILEIDLKSPYLRLETYKANGLAATSAQAAANDSEGHRAIAAINGDFFAAAGYPVDNTVVNGRTFMATVSFRSHLALTEDLRPYIEQFSFSGMLIAKNGTLLALDAVNTSRVIGAAMLYNSYYGAATGTDNTGVECSLTPLFATWRANDTLIFLVTSKQTAGNMAIPSAGMVLSGGSGSPSTFITTNVSVNDTVKIYVGFNPKSIKKIVHLIGGAGRLVKNGVNVAITSASNEGLAGNFYNVRNFRTFAGFNADTSKFYFCTVDIHGTVSRGMNFDEMANFLLSIKVSDAFNLDGGGSTTMVVNSKVVNYTNDLGIERSVANTLQAICTAPSGLMGFLNLIEGRTEVLPGTTLTFHGESKDYYSKPISLPSGLKWSVDPTIGSIDSTGLFIAKNVVDSGWVRIQYTTFSDSARVIVVKAPAPVIDGPAGVAYAFGLKQNFPNPFNPVTNFQFSIGNFQFVRLRVLDLLGREVAILVNGVRSPGNYRVSWDASGLTSGVYFYRLEGGSFVATKKLVLLK